MKTINKDNIRRYVMEGDRVIPGISTIHFDEISRKRIFAAIDSSNFNDVRLIRENYTNLKFKLGRIPKLKDFDDYGEMGVCRLLNWESNEVPLNIGGYKFDRKTRTLPVFINYDKAEDISDTTKYEDHFVDSGTLIAISKSGRSVDSEDVQNFLHARERGIDVHLLVRKNKEDRISKEFYYLGRMYATGQKQEFQMPNTTKTAVEIEWKLDTPVREDIYQYIIG